MQRLIILALVIGLSASTAVAGDYGTIKIDYVGQGDHLGNGGEFKWAIDTPPDASGGNLFPSAWDIAPSVVSGKLITFCIELAQHIQNPLREYDINKLTNAPVPGTSMSASTAAKLNVLATNFYDEAVAGTKYDAGAFQTAVWKLLYNSTGSINQGATAGAGSLLVANGQTVGAAADALLAQVNGGLQAVAGLKTLALTYNNSSNGTKDAQDQLIVVSVPEATSILAFGSVAGAIGLVMRRRRK